MRGIRGGNFRLEMKLLEEDGGKILDPRKIRFRGSHGTGFKKIALLSGGHIITLSWVPPVGDKQNYASILRTHKATIIINFKCLPQL